MALLRRFSRLVLADLHALLDQLEEPDILLRQAVREMEEILGRQQQQHKQLLRELAQIDQREDEINQAQTAVEHELDLCFEYGRESIARTLLKRRLEAQCVLRLLAQRRDRVVRSRGELEENIAQNRAQLESIKEKVELLTIDKPQAPAAETWPDMALAIRDQQVEIELLREKQKRGLQ